MAQRLRELIKRQKNENAKDGASATLPITLAALIRRGVRINHIGGRRRIASRNQSTAERPKSKNQMEDVSSKRRHLWQLFRQCHQIVYVGQTYSLNDRQPSHGCNMRNDKKSQCI